MSSIARPVRLRADVDALADAVDLLRFDLAAPTRQDRTSRRDHLLAVLRRHLEPRLADPDGPVVVVIFGPTGSGKSTITNTLAGRAISRSGALRPTTREAVIWAHHDVATRIESSALAASGPVEVVADDHPLLHSLVVVDTPDIDSVEVDHRRQTEAILASADVAIAITTPQRYADAVPWDVLAALTERDLHLIVVMNRAARRSGGAVSDLAALLRDARVGGIRSADDIVVIQEQRTRGDGRLPTAAVRHLASRLESIAVRRDAVVQASIAGAGRNAVDVARELAAAVAEQEAEGGALAAVIDEAVDAQRQEIAARIRSGDLVRDEVVERWRRLVGVSDLTAVMGRGVARLRDLLRSGDVVDPQGVARVESEVRDELVELGMRRAARARTAVDLAWSASPAGSGLLERVADDQHRRRATLRDSVAGWQSEVVARVSAEGGGRFRVARAATVGINAAATVLLLGVFASTGGITGTEIGVAAGAAATQHAVLERLFGSAAAGRLAREVQESLVDRLGAATEDAVAPFRSALAAAVDDPSAAEAVLERAEAVESSLEVYLDG